MIRTKIVKKSIKIAFEVYPKINHEIDTIFHASWRPTRLPKPSQNPSKIDEKSTQMDHQHRSKFCMHFGWPFDGFWSRHGPKTPPKWKGFWGPFSSFFGSWSHLGAKMAPRPPQELPEPLQDAPRTPQDGPKITKLEPRWSQDPPNLEPRCQPRPPTGGQEPVKKQQNENIKTIHNLQLSMGAAGCSRRRRRSGRALIEEGVDPCQGSHQ